MREHLRDQASALLAIAKTLICISQPHCNHFKVKIFSPTITANPRYLYVDQKKTMNIRSASIQAVIKSKIFINIVFRLFILVLINKFK